MLSDVRRGFVSIAAAEQDYGVAIDDGAMDAVRTAKLRAKRTDTTAMFDFGPEREVWEAVFTDSRMQALNRHL